ncbi:MAG: SH3 domain-containing protein [Anaerolineae bacterium]|nr:SH3 domain-containing protein [Anaerolineae bacterium]
MPPRISLLLCGLLLLTGGRAARAQDGYAAAARIVNPGVAYHLDGTAGTVAPREDAVLAVSAGDSLETDRSGRVLLTFAEDLQILLLPSSRLEVLGNRLADDGTYQLRLRVEGHTVQRFDSAGAQKIALNIETERGEVRAVRGWFALWSDLERSTVITVAEGNVDFVPTWGPPLYSAQAAEGIVAELNTARIIDVTEPYNGARMIGLASDCVGHVQVAGGVLNIRAGTSVGYAIIGDVLDGATVRIMGITEDGDWYRIQRYSGFGWLLTSGVQAECPNLPIYPNLSGENNRELFDVEQTEIDLLAPFYGQFDDDVWFYRWREQAEPG